MADFIVIQHVPHESLGLLENILQKHQASYEIYRVWVGEMPEKSFLSQCKGVIILGGPMGVYETEQFPFIIRELDFIKAAMLEDIPLLGICLGAQLMAAATEAKVYPGPAKEIGWYDLKLTDEGLKDPLFGQLGEVLTVFQWHGDTYDLPVGAKHLARSEAVTQQAFRWGQLSYGLQFHLEVTEEMIIDWFDKNRQDVIKAGFPIDQAEVIEKTKELLPILHRHAENFLAGWVKAVLGTREC